MFNIIACIAMLVLIVMSAVVTVAYLRQMHRDERIESCQKRQLENAKIVVCPKWDKEECRNFGMKDCGEFYHDLKKWVGEWQPKPKEGETADVDG